MMLVCSVCKEEKHEDSFYKRRDRPKGYTSSCKDCRLKTMRDTWIPRKQSEYKLKTNYGMTLEEYQSMLVEQNGVCAICKKEEIAKSNAGYIKSLAVDHCHDTGKIRGLLCQNCNIGLGKFNDDIELLKSAIEYLKENI